MFGGWGASEAHDRDSASQIRFIPAEDLVHAAWRTLTDQCWLKQPIDLSVNLFGLEQTVFVPWKDIPSMVFLQLFVDRTLMHNLVVAVGAFSLTIQTHVA